MVYFREHARDGGSIAVVQLSRARWCPHMGSHYGPGTWDHLQTSSTLHWSADQRQPLTSEPPPALHFFVLLHSPPPLAHHVFKDRAGAKCPSSALALCSSTSLRVPCVSVQCAPSSVQCAPKEVKTKIAIVLPLFSSFLSPPKFSACSSIKWLCFTAFMASGEARASLV